MEDDEAKAGHDYGNAANRDDSNNTQAAREAGLHVPQRSDGKGKDDEVGEDVLQRSMMVGSERTKQGRGLPVKQAHNK